MNSGTALFLAALLLLAGTIAYFVLSQPDVADRPVAEAPSAVERTADEQAAGAAGGQPAKPAAPADSEQPSAESTGESAGDDAAEPTASQQEAAQQEPKQEEAAAEAEQRPQPAESAPADDSQAKSTESATQAPTSQERQDEQPSESQTQVAALPEPQVEEREEQAKPDDRSPEAEPGPQVSFDVVRIARDGGLVAAGRSPSGSRVFLLRDGKVEAEAEADRDGNWVLILDQPLPPGDYELSLEAWLPSGEKIRSPELVIASVPRPITEDSRAAQSDQQRAEQEEEPPAETESAAVSDEPVAIAVPKEGGGGRVLQGSREQEGEGIRTVGLSILSVDYDATGFIKVAGRGLPDATILAYLDNSAIGRTQVAANERWLIAPERAVAEGIYQLRVDQLNEAGEVVARLETVFARTLFVADLPRDQMVVVQPGNSLWRLARRVYGEGMLYSVIYDANKGQIRDPDLIYPGQIFIAPRRN